MKNSRTRKTWDSKEIQIITNAVANYPTNMNYAFEQAHAKLPDRSFAAIQKKYYNHTRDGSNVITAMATRTGTRVLNRKNVTIPRKNKTAEMRMQVVIDSIQKMTPKEKQKIISYILEI